jgi:hypothetical protein
VKKMARRADARLVPLISFMGSFTDWADVTHGRQKEFGQLILPPPELRRGMAVAIDKGMKEAVLVTAFLKAEQLAKDVQQVATPRGGFTDMARCFPDVQLRPFKAPTEFAGRPPAEARQAFATGRARGGEGSRVEGDRTSQDTPPVGPLELPVHRGHVVPDLSSYDFAAPRCIIPYATQQGEISFARNTGTTATSSRCT